jgi:hypothetical protein
MVFNNLNEAFELINFSLNPMIEEREKNNF